MKLLLITILSLLFVSCASNQSDRDPASEVKVDDGIAHESYMMSR